MSRHKAQPSELDSPAPVAAAASGAPLQPPLPHSAPPSSAPPPAPLPLPPVAPAAPTAAATTTAGGRRLSSDVAGLPSVGALRIEVGTAGTAGAARPPPPPHPGGLGELDLVGLLTHPHLGVAVFEYFGDDTAAATALRGTCRELRDAVAQVAWHDPITKIVWPRRWRAAFPAATAANVSYTGTELSKLTDADFEHFRGVRELIMSGCRQATITDAAFAHLAGIHTL